MNTYVVCPLGNPPSPQLREVQVMTSGSAGTAHWGADSAHGQTPGGTKVRPSYTEAPALKSTQHHQEAPEACPEPGRAAAKHHSHPNTCHSGDSSCLS